MDLVADESVDQSIVLCLRQDGHQVLAVAEMDPGITDDAVLEAANERNALLLTADKDFGELVFRQRRVSKGVLLIRLAGLSQEAKIAAISSAIRDRQDELLGAFSVLTAGTIRIRRPER